jgi:dimethylargininase
LNAPDRLFQLAIVRPPPNSYVNCVSTNPRRKDIDITLAREQHRTYVSVLKEAGIEVIELEPVEAYPDSVFMQDPALLGTHRSVIGRFGEETRSGEAKVLINDLKNHGVRVGALNSVEAPGTMEGGDIVVTDRGIFVGESQRTNANGIKQLKFLLREQVVRSVKTGLMHLLCGCSYLNKGNMIVAPDIVSPTLFAGFRFVEIPRAESYAADALYLGAGKVLIPSGFQRTVSKLKRAGYRPVEIDVSEFRKGDGGVTCLSSPVFELF